MVGFYTTNKTWSAMAFTKLYFDADSWRLVSAGGLGNIGYQFYLPGTINDYIGYNSAATFLMVELQRRVFWELLIGLNYSFTTFDTEFDIYLPITGNTTLHSLGLTRAAGTRDNTCYPLEGFESNIKYKLYQEFLDNEFVSNRIEIDFNNFYVAREDKEVSAWRLYGGFGIGDLSFNRQFVIDYKNIRGYPQGDYRGDQMLAIQGEYRCNFHEKMGLVGFFGLATVFSAMNEEDSGKMRPGVGTGYRYVRFPDNHMSVGFDIAMGIVDGGLYFRIEEAF